MSKAGLLEIVVLGGGSAGWITACLLHKAWVDQGIHITLVESPQIGIIGVGEGSTPQLKAFFDRLEIDENEWMPRCDATYKLGIRFTGWSDRPGYESYFHPFQSPVDLHTEAGFFGNCALARRGFDAPALPDPWFLAARLADAGKAPHSVETFPFEPSYGYHFDSHKLSAFLQDWGTARGITHLERKVADVEIGPDGDVTSLMCDNHERIEGDFFIDCSGFAGVIAQQALDGQFISFADNLLNDRAVVMPTEHSGAFKPQTDSFAMSAGWRWSIPLASRVGNGYVYSSAYISDEDAEAELRAACGSQAQARFLKMRVGRVQHSWNRNCLATGLAQGFIEPLEATALHIVVATALEFIEAYQGGGFTDAHRDAFNARIGAHYDGIRDYIVAHYRLNQRNNGDYWRDNRANQHLSQNLRAMMTAWFTHEDFTVASKAIYSTPAYLAMSWHALFAGYGTFPEPSKMQPAPEDAEKAVRKASDLIETCAKNFPELESPAGTIS